MKNIDPSFDNIPPVKDLVRQGIEVNNAGISQRELAVKCNFAEDGVSMMSMVKAGKAKMKLSRVGVFSEVLKIDPTLLLLSALKEKLGADKDAWDAVQKVFNSTVREDEQPYLQALRNVEEKTGQKVVFTEASIKHLEKFIESEMLV